jgi:outer membrane immunogenic protein
MIRKFGITLAAIVSVGAISAASAADMAVKARPMPVVVPIYNWTGCYIGLSGGAKGIGPRDTAFIPAAGIAPAAQLDLGRGEAETWLAGGQVGCNYQSGKWVFGVEGDGHAQRWGTSSTISGALPIPFVAGDTFDLNSHWQASARARVGYAMDRTMFYVTGGAAFTGVKATTNYIPFGIFPGILTSDSRNLVGWTIGAGVEYAATDNFTLGLEGRYSDYGTQRFNSGLLAVATIPGAAVVFANSPTFREVRIETGEILFKANWKFGPTTAVVAKY